MSKDYSDFKEGRAFFRLCMSNGLEPSLQDCDVNEEFTRGFCFERDNKLIERVESWANSLIQTCSL